MPQNWNETSRADVKAMPLTISDERVAQFFGLSIADVRSIRNERQDTVMMKTLLAHRLIPRGIA